MYNLNYTPTNLEVQSLSEIISGGTRTKKVEYHCSRPALPKLFSTATQFLERQSIATHIAFKYQVLICLATGP
jgi:hypothetical protein